MSAAMLKILPIILSVIIASAVLVIWYFIGKKEKKIAKEEGKKSRDVLGSIPIRMFYPDGMIELKDGTFTKVFSFGDVNFQNASGESQLRIFKGYSELLNAVPERMHLQIVIRNLRTDSKSDVYTKIRYNPQRDAYNGYRSEYNALIHGALRDGKNGLLQAKYLVLSYTGERDTVKAKSVFDSVEKSLREAVSRIAPGLQFESLTQTETLRTFFSCYNQDMEGCFENCTIGGVPAFSIDRMLEQGMTAKDVIAPSSFCFGDTSFALGRKYGRAFYLHSVPSELTTDYMQALMSLDFASIISIHYDPVPVQKAVRIVKNYIMNVQGDIARSQRQAVKNGYSADIISPSKDESHRAAKDLLEDFRVHKQKAFSTTMVVTIFADTKAELEKNTKQLTAIASGSHQAPLKTLCGQQEDGLNTCLPLGSDRIMIRRLLTTESCAVFIPFMSQELDQQNGIYLGTNEMTRNLILYNRLSAKNYNGVLIGASGSGKSAQAKLEILQTLMRDKRNKVYIIDPDMEYVPLAKMADGQVINVSPSTNTYLNPLDMDLNYADANDPLALKSDYIVGLLEIMQHGREITSSERSIIDRCVRNIYRSYIEHMIAINRSGEHVTCDTSAMPTLRDLYYELKSQSGPDAENLATTLELYATGTMQTFANRTNVDTSKRLVIYDINQLGSGLKALGLHVALNDLFVKIKENKANGFWSYVYIDEMHVLLASPSATTFLSEIWRRARKWNGVLTGITQGIQEIMGSPEAQDIIKNSEYVTTMSVSQPDRVALSELLNLSDAELEKITDARPGHGLIKVGAVKIPFNNEIDNVQFPKLYNLINTTGDKKAG